MKNRHVQFVFAFLAGWVNRSQQDLIEYLKTENEIYREELGKKRIQFTDEQRRRLATRILTVSLFIASLHLRYKNLIFPHRSSVNSK